MTMHLQKPPITAAELDPAWPEAVRSATPAVKLRAGAGNTIEGWSETRNRFMQIQLPGGGTQFLTTGDRDLIFNAIIDNNPSGQDK